MTNVYDFLAPLVRRTRGRFPFYRFSEALRRKSARAYTGQTRQMRYEGRTLEVEPSKYLGGKLWWAYGRELPMMNWAHKNSAPGGVFLDVGACLGEWSYYMQRRGRRSIAFEPNPEYASRLAVPTRAFALGAKHGRVDLTTDDDQNEGRQIPTSSTSPNSYPVVPLDSLRFTDPITLIKIDTEGMETDVLQGARATIQSSRPVIVLEDNRNGALRTLLQDGYTIGLRIGDNVGLLPPEQVPSLSKAHQRAADWDAADAEQRMSEAV